MNSDASTLWSQSLHEGNMVPPATTEEDFSNYLDLDLDFSHFDDVPPDQTQVDTAMDAYNMDLDESPHFMANGTQLTYNQHHAVQPPQQQMQSRGGAQGQLYQQAQRYQRPRPVIPPTPSSNELQGGIATYYHPGQVVYDQYPNKEDQISFTPLVSPAVTPADASFHMPDYAVPGEYFSPLTSPALEAQNNSHYRVYQGPHSSDSGTTTSPADHNLESGASVPSTPVAPKSSRRKQSLNKSAPRSVRQSPIVKPQSRRKQAMVNLDPATVAELADAQHNECAIAKRLSPGERGTGSATSEQDSVSPEALAEVLMPPPAMPHVVQRSPGLAAHSKSPFMQGNEPATPATLMRLQKGNISHSPQAATESRSSTEGSGVDVMEDIMLPEPAATNRPTLTPIKTSGAELDQSTPKLASQGSNSRTGSVSTAVSASSTPVALTPQSKDVFSPNETDPKRGKSGSRLAKKRQSVSSSQVSPAIRPKISPSIKPLMPSGSAGSVSADHSALYLASKSNYQNILEGTHLPGVTYPEALAENLSSKRTSHKIAEQGRRNRINTALKEIEGLLPPTPALLAHVKKDPAGSPDAETSEKATSTAQTTSKASTVEMAIVYIKALQAELADTKTKLEVAEKKLSENNSASSQSSD